MSEEIRSGSVLPEELIDMFAGPLSEARAELANAEEKRAGAEACRQAAEKYFERTSASEAAARGKLESLRSAGHAALATITDAPAEDTLGAQMLLDGMDGDEFFDLQSDVEALNHYARSDEHPIVITTGTGCGSPVVSILELQKEQSGTEPVAEIWRSRAGNSHSLQFAIKDVFTNIHPAQETVDSSNIRRISRLGTGRLSVEVGTLDVPGAPIDQLNFADTAQEATDLFELARDDDTLLPAAVIYGNEAVRAFTALLGEKYQAMRMPLFGILKELGVSYSGVGFIKDSVTQTGAQEGFAADLWNLAGTVLAYGDNLQQATIDANFWEVSADMQEFLRVPDAVVIDSIRAKFIHAMTAYVEGGKVVMEGSAHDISLDKAWAATWRIMGEKGFKSLSEKALNNSDGALEKAKIRQAVIRDRLSNPVRKIRRRERRALERADQEEQANILIINWRKQHPMINLGSLKCQQP